MLIAKFDKSEYNHIVSNKGVKHVYINLCNIKINKYFEMFMVVDIVNIGIGWRCFWSHILITHYYKKYTRWVHFLFWWESACTNRAENEQQFADFMHNIRMFKKSG